MAAPPRIGLVLGGGGAVGGAFHAGVLLALTEGLGWDARRADWLVGTSAGSMTAAMLRAGLPPRDLAARAHGAALSPEGQRLLAQVGPPPSPPDLSIDWRNLAFPPEGPGAVRHALLHPWRVRPSALSATAVPEGRNSTEPIQKLLAPIFGGSWPERPLWLVAVRLRDAARVVFGRDEIAGATVPLAVASSCAIPGVFTPVEVGDARYVDGGAFSTTNADLVRRLRLDLVLVSSPMSIARLGLPGRADGAVRVALRTALRQELAGIRRHTRCVLFEPGPADLAAMGRNPMDGAKRGAVARQARETTLRRLDEPSVRERLAALA